MVGVVGIICTLLGAIVGAVSALMIQERQLKHANTTRFHKMRVEFYALYSQAINKSFATWSRGGNDAAFLETLLLSMERIQLIGSKALREQARKLNEIVNAISESVDKKSEVAKRRKAFYTALAGFHSTARLELGIEAPEERAREIADQTESEQEIVDPPESES